MKKPSGPRLSSHTARLIAGVIAIILGGSPLAIARAEIIGGVNFPQGAVSFADAVSSFAPVIVSGNPTNPHLGAANALGLPTGVGDLCLNQASCAYVSLGDGGSITLEFVDNRLTGGGNSDLDLWIFEVGGDVEDTFVTISKDGGTFFSVGKVFGSTSGIDIDQFGFTTSDQFRFVRLTDDPDADEQAPGGPTVGADIDAVGAISTTPVPEPGTFLLLGSGLAALGGIAWRRRRK